MKRLAFLGFAFVLHLMEMTNGLESCKGSFTPPVIERVTVDPVQEVTGRRLRGVDIMVEMTSKVPLSVSWVDLKARWPRIASEVEPNFKSSVKVDGERYVFKLEDRPDSRANTTDDLIDGIVFKLIYDHNCNSVYFATEIPELMAMVEESIRIPTVTEMPQTRYILEGDEEDRLTLKMSFAQGGGIPSLSASGSWISCQRAYDQRDGRLESFLRSTSFEERRANSTFRKSDGLPEWICETALPGDVDSRIMGLQTFFWKSPRIRFLVYVATELRRRGVDEPAVMVAAGSRAEKVIENGATAIHALSHNTNGFFCITDTYSHPYISAARGADITTGTFQLLTPNTSQNDDLNLNLFYRYLQVLHFDVNPGSNEGEEYVCSAASGSVVTSERFRFVGYQADEKPTEIAD